MKNLILVLNSGSSSLKYSLFDNSDNLNLIDKGHQERIGLPEGSEDYGTAIKNVLDDLVTTNKVDNLSDIKIIGHRVVHGGEEFRQPTILTPEIVKKLKIYSKLAPLHNPANILGIETCMRLFPGATNVAVFDTAFYESIPAESYIYALPYELYTQNKIRKYGFHGISHKYISRLAKEKLGRTVQRLITCHLGAGSSITALQNGKPIDTSMGFTPTDGLVMESRSGSIDPTIPLYMISELGYKPEEVFDILNHKSGYLGICSLKDFREILASKDELSKLTYKIFLNSVVKHIGSNIALLGGIDAIVFTAGIGEGSAKFRKDAMAHFGFIGAKIDDQRNQEGMNIISTDDSQVKILMLPTDEALEIAKETRMLVSENK